MADQSSCEVDSGVASSIVTPVNGETSLQSSVMEQVTTPGAAASSIEEQQKALINADDIEEDDEEFVDETLMERLYGLTEMFPDGLRSFGASAASKSISLAKKAYSLTRTVVWFTSTTSILLFAPVLFEVERLNTEESIKQSRNKLMLGPGTAMSGPPGSMMGGPPQ